MGFGFYGKLPQHGDFVAQNIEADILRALETFLDQRLGYAKNQLAEIWQNNFDKMPVWRFWISAQTWGAPLCGAFTASQDKVGRKFPKVIVYAPSVHSDFPNPPSIDSDMSWYEQFDQAFEELKNDEELDDVMANLIPIQQAIGEAPEPETDQFWAVSSADDFEGLLEDVKSTDHFCAAQTRSYWWTMGGEGHQAAFLSVRGLPDEANFIYFVQGVPKPEEELIEEPEQKQEPEDEPLELCGD